MIDGKEMFRLIVMCKNNWRDDSSRGHNKNYPEPSRMGSRLVDDKKEKKSKMWKSFPNVAKVYSTKSAKEEKFSVINFC